MNAYDSSELVEVAPFAPAQLERFRSGLFAYNVVVGNNVNRF